MARQNKHLFGKPMGLSLPDLPVTAEPAAYLTCAHQLGHRLEEGDDPDDMR